MPGPGDEDLKETVERSLDDVDDDPRAEGLSHGRLANLDEDLVTLTQSRVEQERWLRKARREVAGARSSRPPPPSDLLDSSEATLAGVAEEPPAVRPSQRPRVEVPRPSRPPPELDEPFSSPDHPIDAPLDVTKPMLSLTLQEQVARRSFAPPPPAPRDGGATPAPRVSSIPPTVRAGSTKHVSGRPSRPAPPPAAPTSDRIPLDEDTASIVQVAAIGAIVLVVLLLAAWWIGSR